MSSSDRAARPRPIAWFWRVGGFVAAFLGATMLARGARFALTGRARLPAGPSASAEPYFLLYRGTGVAAVFAATWFTLALYEELVFRGYPFQVLVQRFRPVTAICASALAFGWLHYSNPGMTLVGAVATGLWGVLLCTLVVRSRSLWTCIGFHFAGNFVQNTVLGSPTSGMTFGTSMLTVEMAPTVFAGSPSGVEASIPVLLAGAIALGWILRSGSWAPRAGAGVLFSNG